MHFNIPLIEKLAKATPRKSIMEWLCMTFCYASVIVVNDHFELIRALGLPERIEATIRLIGVYLYIILTAYSFHKTQKNETNTYHNKVATDMANLDKPDRISSAQGTQVHAQGNRPDEPQSKFADTGSEQDTSI